MRHKLFEGGVTKLISRGAVQRAAAVGVLPYDPIRDEVVVIRQFCAGVMVAQHNPWIVESVTGLGHFRCNKRRWNLQSRI